MNMYVLICRAAGNMDCGMGLGRMSMPMTVLSTRVLGKMVQKLVKDALSTKMVTATSGNLSAPWNG